MRDKNKILSSKNQGPASPDASQGGFTLIELLVVIAVIALLASVVVIALADARQKSRDVKRLSDIESMNTAFELYFASYKGYPTSTAGSPAGLSPKFAATLPSNPQPADSNCGALDYNTLNASIPVGTMAGAYYYYPSGSVFLAADGITDIYPDYSFYFCLGYPVGNFGPGMHYMSPQGLR